MKQDRMRGVGVLRLAMTIMTAAAVVPATLGAQAGAGGRAPTRDTVRVFVRPSGADRTMLAKLDSLMRELEVTPLESPVRAKLMAELGAVMTRFGAPAHAAGSSAGLVAAELGARMRINVERAAGSSGPIRHEEVRRQLAAVIPRGYVGFDAQGPVVRTLRESGEFARYLAFPAVVGVEPNSPADRAGISRGDTLLAYNGRDVRTELNLTEMFAPDRRLAVTVRRDGSTKDFTVVVAEASPMIMERRLSSLLEPSLPAQFVVTTRGGGAGMAAAGAGGLSPSVRPSRAEGVSVVGPRRVAPLMMATGVWGAELLALKPELAKVFGASRGVLVVDVPPGSPGHRMGLRVSDVIVKLNGVDVVSIDDLRVRLARMQEKTAELEILRDKKTRTISIETGR